MDYRKVFLGKMKHQKTALSDGFNVTVDSRLSIVPQTVVILYHKFDLLQMQPKKVNSI